jgi:hypothetical protein
LSLVFATSIQLSRGQCIDNAADDTKSRLEAIKIQRDSSIVTSDKFLVTVLSASRVVSVIAGYLAIHSSIACLPAPVWPRLESCPRPVGEPFAPVELILLVDRLFAHGEPELLLSGDTCVIYEKKRAKHESWRLHERNCQLVFIK